MVRRQLSIQDRGRAIGWLHDGQTQRTVAQHLNVSQGIIGRLWQRFRTTNAVQNRPRSGRPRSTTAREDRFLMITALQQRFVTARHLRDQLRAARGTNVSDQTIRNRLRDRGLQCRHPAVRPPLLDRHRRARRDWCRHHIRWNRGQWAETMFTDESRFSLQFNDGQARVYRRQGERFADLNVAQRLPFGGGSVMVWAGISMNHRTPLYVVNGNLTGQRYLNEIVQPLVIPLLQRIGPGDQEFQDDNTRPHRARVVTDFLQQQNVQHMDWPACSPDLSPIEHAWDELGRRV